MVDGLRTQETAVTVSTPRINNRPGCPAFTSSYSAGVVAVEGRDRAGFYEGGIPDPVPRHPSWWSIFRGQDFL
jgi:hypothetical protein